MQSFVVFFDQLPLIIRTLWNQDLIKCRVGWFLGQAAKGWNIFFARDMFNNSIITLYIEFLLEDFPGAMVI